VQRQACAASSVWQLLFEVVGRDAIASDMQGWWAYWVRCCNNLSGNDILPIADIWWIAVAGLRRATMPRLLVIRTRGGIANDADVGVMATPTRWDGTYVTILGDGGHFDPVWWPEGTRNRATRPNGLPDTHAVHSINADASPAVGVAWALGMSVTGLCPLSDRNRPNNCAVEQLNIDRAAMLQWIASAQAILRPGYDHAESQGHIAPLPGWGDRTLPPHVVLLCRPIDPPHVCRHTNRNPLVDMIVGCMGTDDADTVQLGHGSAGVLRVLTIDATKACMAIAVDGASCLNRIREVRANINPAAAGRGGQ